MRIAVLATAHTVPLSETVLAIQRTGMEALVLSGDEPVEKLVSADGYVLLAGSNEDWAKADAQMLATLLKTQSAQGKPILGLGYSGAKLLVENGLVPGLYKYFVGLGLVEKPSLGRDVAEIQIRLSEDYQYNAFTRCLRSRELVPVHLTTPAEFVIPCGLLAEIKAQGLSVFLYCDAQGVPLPGNNIAAISNKAGNVMALLARPQENSPGEEAIFKSLRDHLDSGFVEQVEPLYYWPRKGGS